VQLQRALQSICATATGHAHLDDLKQTKAPDALAANLSISPYHPESLFCAALLSATTLTH
jgi:hypothetical protein